MKIFFSFFINILTVDETILTHFQGINLDIQRKTMQYLWDMTKNFLFYFPDQSICLFFLYDLCKNPSYLNLFFEIMSYIRWKKPRTVYYHQNSNTSYQLKEWRQFLHRHLRIYKCKSNIINTARQYVYINKVTGVVGTIMITVILLLNERYWLWNIDMVLTIFALAVSWHT